MYPKTQKNKRFLISFGVLAVVLVIIVLAVNRPYLWKAQFGGGGAQTSETLSSASFASIKASAVNEFSSLRTRTDAALPVIQPYSAGYAKLLDEGKKIDACKSRYEMLQFTDSQKTAYELHLLNHECIPLDAEMGRLLSAVEWPQKATALSANIGDLQKQPLKSYLTSKEISSLSDLKNSIDATLLVPFSKYTAADKYSAKGESLIKNWVQTNKILLAANIGAFKKLRINKITTIKKLGDLSLSNGYIVLHAINSVGEQEGVPIQQASLARRQIVLFIHYANETVPLATRNMINSQTGESNEALSQMSYGQNSFSTNVCEVSEDIPRPADYEQTVDHALYLCDPYVDYRNYSTIIVYPVSVGPNGTTRQYNYDTDDGMVPLAVISMGEHPTFAAMAVTHEVGHTLSLDHSNGLESGSAAYDADHVSYVEYGDAFDVMGATSFADFNCYQKEKLGWIEPIAYSPGTSTYTISAMGKNDGQPKCVKVPTSASHCPNLYVEYRKRVGIDANIPSSMAADGLALHCDGATTEYAEETTSALLDMRPNTLSSDIGDFQDALLYFSLYTSIYGRLPDLGYRISFIPLADDKAQVAITPYP